MSKDKALTGAAGEYYVAFRFAAEGYAVGLTPRETTSIYLIVANPETGKSVTIQTKTARKAFVRSKKEIPYWKWRVGKIRKPHKNFFYVFVDLKDDLNQTPDMFVVNSYELAGLLNEYSGDVWCDEINVDNASSYKDQWEVIKNVLEAQDDG